MFGAPVLFARSDNVVSRSAVPASSPNQACASLEVTAVATTQFLLATYATRP